MKNVFVTLPTPESKFPKPSKPKPIVHLSELDEQAVKRARDSSFAIAYQMTDRMEKAGVTSDDLWRYIKVHHKVSSRKDLTEKQWVRIEARLRAASKSQRLFYILMYKVKVWKEQNVESENA